MKQDELVAKLMEKYLVGRVQPIRDQLELAIRDAILETLGEAAKVADKEAKAYHDNLPPNNKGLNGSISKFADLNSAIACERAAAKLRQLAEISSPASKPQDATATSAARNIKNDADEGEAARKETE